MTRILLIEDEENYALALCGNLRDLMPAWKVEMAATMAAGILAAASIAPGLIILDLCLPDSSPENSVESIKAISPDAPVVVLTGKAAREGDFFAKCINAGALAVWEKSMLHGGGMIYFIHACNTAIAIHESIRAHA